MKFFRIFPEAWASTSCLFGNSTRNTALGSASSTSPSTSIASFFAIKLPSPEPGSTDIGYPARRRKPCLRITSALIDHSANATNRPVSHLFSPGVKGDPVTRTHPGSNCSRNRALCIPKNGPNTIIAQLRPDIYPVTAMEIRIQPGDLPLTTASSRLKTSSGVPNPSISNVRPEDR